MSSIWAVVVIHGVGDTEPGATLGTLIPELLKQRPALVENAAPQTRLLIEPAAKPPELDDPLEPPEAHTESACEWNQRFPMHLRTFDVRGAAPGKPDRAVFAEVFWADLSRTGVGFWPMVRSALSLVFDLRHVSNIAAAADSPVNARLRVILYWMSWLLCGPVAGLAAFMAGLLAARYFAAGVYGQLPLPAPTAGMKELALLAFAVLAAVAVFVRRRRLPRDSDEIWLLFTRWILIGALVSALLAVVRLRNPSFPWDTSIADTLTWELQLGGNVPGATFTHFAVLLWVAYIAYVVLALEALVALGVWLWGRLPSLVKSWSRKRAPEPDDPDYSAAASLDAALGVAMLQVLLWVIIGAMVGAGVLKGLFTGGGVTQTVVTGFMLKLGVAAVIAACAAFVWWRRQQAAKEKKESMPRLLVHALIMSALIGLTLASMLVFALIVVTGSPLLQEWLSPVKAMVLGAFMALVALVLYFLRAHVLDALHIAVDVTSHFHRRHLDVDGKVKLAAKDFSIQQRIEARGRRVLQEVVYRMGDVTHVTVVAHSQGTVIAVDLLWQPWIGRLLAGKEVHFVTMGSPITHLYQHYFPQRYPRLFIEGRFNSQWGSLQETVDRWSNIHRIDDFIGTTVSGDGVEFPKNHAHIGLGGHTGYWKDGKAVRLMAAHLPG